MSQWRDDAHRRVRALGRAARRPGPERDAALLLVKAAAATVLAWLFASTVLDSPVPFYAPMAALLVVDRTMVRSVAASAQRVAAVVLGLGIAWGVALLVGVTWWSMFGVVLVALVIGRWSRLGEHGIQVPAMVLLSLITVRGTSEQFTYLTIVETVAGGVIGVAVNAVVLPPLHLTKPRQRVRAFAREVHDLLDEMARGLRGDWDHETARGWLRRGSDIADRAPSVVEDIHQGRESTRLNVRTGLRPTDIDWEGYEQTVSTLRRVLWQVTGIARILVDADEDSEHQPAPSPTFLSRYGEVLDALADSVQHLGRHDDEARTAFELRTQRALDVLAGLRDDVHATPLEDPTVWPVYGALISDSTRAVRDLRASWRSAVVPTDTGPMRLPARRAARARSEDPDA